MAKRKPANAVTELRGHLRKHPDLRAIELLVADVNGVLRGKQIQRRDFEKTFADGFAMPGGTVLLNRTLIEDYEEPDVAAGYALVEQVRSASRPPLRALLEHAGVRASATLLTTGVVPASALDDFTTAQLSRFAPVLASEMILPAFAAAGLRSTPYARARDISGEQTLALIEADPMAGQTSEPIMPDRDWLQLQAICEG